MRLPCWVAPHCADHLRPFPAALKWQVRQLQPTCFRLRTCAYRPASYAKFYCAGSTVSWMHGSVGGRRTLYHDFRCFTASATPSPSAVSAVATSFETPANSAPTPPESFAQPVVSNFGWSFPKRLFFFLSAAGLVTGLAFSKPQPPSTSDSQAAVAWGGQGTDSTWASFDNPPPPRSWFPFVPVAQLFTSLGSRLEALGERTTEFFEDQLDKVFPPSHIPLLPDAADLKLPDNLPTLVVDLDKVILKMEHDRKKGWRVLKRPGADDFFKELIYHYEIVVWSDDAFPVAQDVCAKWGVPIVGALHRDQCKRRRGHYIKDLRRLGRRLERVLLLDHDPAAAALQPENGIMIREFDGNPNDTDLIALTDFLKNAALSHHDDIRDFVATYGGGDVDLVKRWIVQQAEREKKAESRRHLGSRLFGGASSSSSTSGVSSSLSRWGHTR